MRYNYRPSTAEIALSNDSSAVLRQLEEKLTALEADREAPAVAPVYELLRRAHVELKAAYKLFVSYALDECPPPYCFDDLEEALADARRALTPDVKP